MIRSYKNRAGFTLVELLLVMAIIGVLASLSLAIVNDAQFDASANATRSRITTVFSILQQKLESYARQRLPIDLSDIDFDSLDIRQKRTYRRKIISDFINVEMPRRAQNVAFQTSGVNLMTIRESIYPSQAFLIGLRNDDDSVTGLTTQQMNDFVTLLVAQGSTAFATRFVVPGVDPLTDGTDLYPENGSLYSLAEMTFDPSDTSTFPTLAARTTSSEYLYRILETANFNGISAIETLGERAFADTDNDGFPELVDSWGNPICFQFEVDFDDDGITDSVGLDPGAAGPGIAVRNLRIRLLSTGKGVETITN